MSEKTKDLKTVSSSHLAVCRKDEEKKIILQKILNKMSLPYW